MARLVSHCLARSHIFRREYAHLLQFLDLFRDELIVVLVYEQLLIGTLCMHKRHEKD